MTSNEILARWHEIESREGLARAKKISRSLTIVALILCVVIGLVSIRYGLASIAYAVAGALVGWLIAERNALDSRIADWPTYRQYIDWSRVRQDLQISSQSRQE